MAHPVTFKGSRLARWILKAFGWKLAFDGFPTLQGVAIVYPHTSNWDFPVGILAKWALGIPANFWGKDSLFKFPVMGAWMRWIGGVPIDRSSPKGVVAEMVQVFEQHKRDGRLLWLALAPEGTRSLTPGWRSGYYQVAVGAQVPVATMARLLRRADATVRRWLAELGLTAPTQAEANRRTGAKRAAATDDTVSWLVDRYRAAERDEQAADDEQRPGHVADRVELRRVEILQPVGV